MAIETQQYLSFSEKKDVLEKLNKFGELIWKNNWIREIRIPQFLLSIKTQNDKEKLLRYLLLRALINQQGIAEKVKELAENLVNEFKDSLLLKPTATFSFKSEKILKIAKSVGGTKGSEIYRVGFLGGIKPWFLFLGRFACFCWFMDRIKLKYKDSFYSFMKELLSTESIENIYYKLIEDEILSIGWVGNDPKACRMFLDWCIFILNEVFKEKIEVQMKDTLMIVDGHVAKVLCRMGFLNRVHYEDRRKFIIQAARMRENIEKEVYEFRKYGIVPFYVDFACFFLGKNCCGEDRAICEVRKDFRSQICNTCVAFKSKICEGIICPLENICKKHVKWTAFRQRG